MKKSLNFRIAVFLILLLVMIFFSLFFKSSPKKQEKLNVVLIVIDALRADHLGCYGYYRDTSPNMDKFAKEGILFKNAFSQGVTTRVSVASIFTSLYPSVHRVFGLGAPLADEFITLPEILKKNGYTTTAFVGPQLSGISNFNQRFQLYDDFNIITEDLSGDLLPHENFAIIPETPQITKKASNWLKQNHFWPFFLYIHYVDVHAPYYPPPYYKKLFWQDNISGKTRFFILNFVQSEYFNPLNYGLIPKGDMLDFVISQYDGEIKYVDDNINVLLEELERLGLSKNTLVILTSDHGEEFQDHGSFFHENTLYDELIHIPLIMRLPKKLPQNKIIHNVVRHIDIMPTILDILNIPNNNIIQGISLLPFIKGEGISQLDSFSELNYAGRYSRTARSDMFKFIETYNYNSNSYDFVLHDLGADSKEQKNLTEDKPQEVKLFKSKLSDYDSSCEKIRKFILREGYINKPVTLDGETKERLKSLGYTE